MIGKVSKPKKGAGVLQDCVNQDNHQTYGIGIILKEIKSTIISVRSPGMIRSPGGRVSNNPKVAVVARV